MSKKPTHYIRFPAISIENSKEYFDYLVSNDQLPRLELYDENGKKIAIRIEKDVAEQLSYSLQKRFHF